MQGENICSFVWKKVIVHLPVLGHIIKTDGIRATISLGINSKNDFGFYDVVFSNEIGSASLRLQMVPIEPPAVPYDLKTEHIQSTSVRISWKQRFDSEFPQTFVIQMSADNIIWFNATTVYVDTEEHEGKFSTGLENLQESTIYFVRMYAYNKGGKSSFTKSFNFTTLTKDKDTTASTDDKSTLIVGVVLGLVIVALALYAAYVTILLKRKSKLKEDTIKGTDISEQSDAKMYVNMGLLTEDRGSQSSKTQADGNKTMADSKEFENQYTDLNNQLRDVGSAYDAISSI
ncbi:uncharacterized protein LOC123559495 [Mercenaria mercenaria]|uniref:uncharacterized protein LOC123559495 n=1 Tax=Mercenaria mercenaria TaxID=6596 RepID=UPI00234EE2E9|nr:uncharacterized protein LOC123559495 [Mercenaria mercenaria]